MSIMTRAVLIPVIAMAAAFGSAEAVPQAIKARYAQLNKVMQKVDFNGFQSFFAPDFFVVSPKGESTKRDDFLAEVKQLFAGATKATAKEKLISASKSHNLVAVKFDFHLDLIGKKGTTHVHEVGVDYWGQVNGQWMFVKTVDTAFTVKGPKGS